MEVVVGQTLTKLIWRKQAQFGEIMEKEREIEERKGIFVKLDE